MISRPRNWHNWQPMYLPYTLKLNPIECLWLTIKARWLNSHVCKKEEKPLERLHQAILDVTANLERTRQTNAIRTLFWQTL
jgi:transposase